MHGAIKMSISGEYFNKLQDLKADIAKLNSKLQKHNFSSNNDLSIGTLQNAVSENKDSKLRFISLSSYLMFLEQFLQKGFLDLDKSDFEAVNRVIEDYDEKKQLHRSFQERSDDVFEQLLKLQMVESECLSIEKLFKKVQATKQTCASLIQKKKEIASSLNKEIYTSADVQKLLTEQENLIKTLSKKLNSYSYSSNVPRVPAGLPSFLNSEESVNTTDEAFEIDTESLSGVKIISTHPNYDILEVFYVDSCMKMSSVEVKITFDDQPTSEARSIIKNLVIRNSPIDVQDLVDAAIKENDFASMLPFLQQRLSES